MTSEDVSARIAVAHRVIGVIKKIESGTQWTALAMAVGTLLGERPPSRRANTMDLFNALALDTAQEMDRIRQERAGNGNNQETPT